MTHTTRIVAVVAVLAALGVGVPVQAQTPLIDDLRMRAEAGDAEAQYNLGVMYANGEGVPEDDVEAVRWYRLAADQGYVNAQNNIRPCTSHLLLRLWKIGRATPDLRIR